MRLDEAVSGWIEDHGNALSPSTRSDIEDIEHVIAMSGRAHMPCDQVDDDDRQSILDTALGGTALNTKAIGEFLSVVLSWARSNQLKNESVETIDNAPRSAPDDLSNRHDEPGEFEKHARTRAEDESDQTAAEPNRPDPTGANEDQGPHEADTDTPAPATDAEATDEAQLVDEDDLEIGSADEELARIDDELIFTHEGDFSSDELAEIDADLSFTYETELDDDELAAIDSDLTFTHESELDDDELAAIDSDLELLLAGGDTSRAEVASFLARVGTVRQSSTAFGDLTSPVSNTTAVKDAGVFSQAAQQGRPQKSVDWVTVFYFAIALVCFGVMIYFYVTS